MYNTKNRYFEKSILESENVYRKIRTPIIILNSYYPIYYC